MSFDLQPHLKGELIELRPLAPQDWDDLFSVACDRLIWEQHPESDRYKEGVFENFFKGALESLSARRDFTVTIRKNLKSRSAGPFWRGNIGAGGTTGK